MRAEDIGHADAPGGLKEPSYVPEGRLSGSTHCNRIDFYYILAQGALDCSLYFLFRIFGTIRTVVAAFHRFGGLAGAGEQTC